MITPSSLQHWTGLVAGILLLTAAAPLKSEPEPSWVPSLNDSQVFITYGELRRLIEQAATAAKPPPSPPAPPVAACLTEARFRLKFVQDKPQLSVTYAVENLTDSWTSLPLGLVRATTPDPLPADTRLARDGEQVLLILEKPGRVSIPLTLTPELDGSYVLQAPAQAALASLEMDAPPADHLVRITQADGGATRHDSATMLSLAPGQAPLRLALVPRDAPGTDAAALDSAIVTEAIFQSQIAQDGAQLTSVILRLEHGAAAALPLTLPPGAELLRCVVSGRPVAAASGADGSLQLSLPATPSTSLDAKTPPSAPAGSEVTLSYFLQGGALHPAEGEFELALPRTPLLIRRLEWTVELPEGLELTAHGNVELKVPPAPMRHVLHLGRRLCRDSITQARITYRQPNSTTR